MEKYSKYFLLDADTVKGRIFQRRRKTIRSRNWRWEY